MEIRTDVTRPKDNYENDKLGKPELDTTRSKKLCQALEGVSGLKSKLGLILDALRHPGGIQSILQAPTAQPDEALELSLEKLISEGPSIINSNIGECNSFMDAIQASICLQGDPPEQKEMVKGGVLDEFYHSIEKLSYVEDRLKSILALIINEDSHLENEVHHRNPTSLETLLDDGYKRIDEIVSACNEQVTTIIAKLF